MSLRYKGAVISATPPTVNSSGPGTAKGVWTLQQQMQYKGSGAWPAPFTPLYIEDVFSTYLYQGTGATQTITNNIDLSGQGGMVWFKARNNGWSNALFDTVRGANKPILSNTTGVESTWTDTLTSFNSNGFSLGADATYYVNNDVTTYVSWTFRKQAKFFDVVTYSGNGVAGRTVAHNLGSVPGVIITKSISGGVSNWAVYHRSLGANKALLLNLTDGELAGSASWNNTAPTSTEFTVGSSTNTNGATRTYVAYLFAHDAGGFGALGTDNVISCGSYTGGGASPVDITLGWEPQLVLIKRSDTAGYEWVMLDTMRAIPTGGSNALLMPNRSDSETIATEYINVTATGFRTIANNNNTNGSGGTFVYIAIRRGPMKTPTVGTSVFSPIASSAAAGTKLTTNFPVDLQLAAFRSFSDGKRAMDRLRGLTTSSTQINPALLTNSTAAEAGTTSTYTSGMDNTGFNMSTEYGGSSSIFWNFRRAPGFFDVVCYTGTGSARTVNHNLTVVPELMIIRARNYSPINWYVYSANIGIDYRIVLDSNSGSSSGYATLAFNNTLPTSTNFTLGSWIGTNGSTYNYVAYLFATCPGVSKVGSYTGSGTTKQIDCGFTGGARFVLIKRTDSTGDWYVWDSARGIVAGNDPYLLLNSTAAEVTNTDYVDTYSAGFEISSTAPAEINANGGTYIFLAIA